MADIAEARRLGLEPGEHYFCVSSIRIVQQHPEAPLCWTDVYAPRDYTAVVELAREHPDQLIIGLIEQRYGRAIAVVDQRVRAKEEKGAICPLSPRTNQRPISSGVVATGSSWSDWSSSNLLSGVTVGGTA